MPLRPLTEADLPMIRRWRNDPAVRQFMFSQHEITESEHLAWFARLSTQTASRVLIHETAGHQADGVVNFTQIEPGPQSAFWGFYLAPAAPRGSGSLLGLDALDFAFGELALHRLNGEVLADNQASIRFHEKLGFTREGTFRDAHFSPASGYSNVFRYAILSSEWPAHRSRLSNGTAFATPSHSPT